MSSYLKEKIEGLFCSCWVLIIGVDNRKSHGHNINKTIVENLQNAYKKIDNTTRGDDLSNAHKALMTTISSRKLTQKIGTYNF